MIAPPRPEAEAPAGVAPGTEGSLAVEQTLRLAREAIEDDIARYRVMLFVAALVLTFTLRVTGLADFWTPTLTFAVAVAYAVVLRVALRRTGNPRWLVAVSLLLDLCLVSSAFVITSLVVPPQTRSVGILFLAYILGPNLFFVLLINSLRSSQVTSLVGAVAAPVLFLGTTLTFAGFHPAQIAVTALLLLAGLVSMAIARQARKNLDRFARLQLLRRYLPPAAVERVMREDPDAALSLGGRLATVTILAADLRGFTAMSEKLAPDEVMTQLNAYHGAMIDVIDAHGGAIDKFIGDGTLVVFGLAGGAEAGAAAAVACAGAMLDALERHNRERAARGASPLGMGIGIHTGPVIAGNLGVPGRRLEFTVIGDAVNTASRLEGETKAAGVPVVVSAATVDLLADRQAVRELGPVSIRGKQQTMRVFSLVHPEDARERPA